MSNSFERWLSKKFKSNDKKKSFIKTTNKESKKFKSMKKSITDEKKRIITLFIDNYFFKIMNFSNYYDRNFHSKFFFKNLQLLEFTLSLKHQFATFRNFESNIISLFIQFFSVFLDNDQIARNVLFDTDDTTIKETMNYTTNVYVVILRTKTHFESFFTNFLDLNLTTNNIRKLNDFKHEKKWIFEAKKKKKKD